MTVELSASAEKELQDLAAAQCRDIGELVQEAIQLYLDAAALTDLEPGDVAETQLKMLGEPFLSQYDPSSGNYAEERGDLLPDWDAATLVQKAKELQKPRESGGQPHLRPSSQRNEKSMTVRTRRSSESVFSDLGFGENEAENLKIRADLMIELSKLIEVQGLTQAAAAKLLGVTQPKVSDLMRGKIDRFSVDSLIQMLCHAGASVSVVVTQRSQVA